MEVVWEKGGSGLVFYTDSAYWNEQEGGNFVLKIWKYEKRDLLLLTVLNLEPLSPMHAHMQISMSNVLKRMIGMSTLDYTMVPMVTERLWPTETWPSSLDWGTGQTITGTPGTRQLALRDIPRWLLQCNMYTVLPHGQGLHQIEFLLALLYWIFCNKKSKNSQAGSQLVVGPMHNALHACTS